MEQEVIYKLTAGDLEQAIEKKLTDIADSRILSKFQHISVSSNTACEVLNISPSTLHRWIKAGKLKPDLTDKRNLKFNLKNILSL